MIRPDWPEFLRLATTGTLVPVWREFLFDCDTAVTAYAKLMASESAQNAGEPLRLPARVARRRREMGALHVRRYIAALGVAAARRRPRLDLVAGAGLDIAHACPPTRWRISIGAARADSRSRSPACLVSSAARSATSATTSSATSSGWARHRPIRSNCPRRCSSSRTSYSPSTTSSAGPTRSRPSTVVTGPTECRAAAPLRRGRGAAR
jgi:hypothetical protein